MRLSKNTEENKVTCNVKITRLTMCYSILQDKNSNPKDKLYYDNCEEFLIAKSDSEGIKAK